MVNLSFPFAYRGPTKPILKFLSTLTPLAPQTNWPLAIREGHLLVWDQFVGEGYHVKAGDVLSWQEVVLEPEIDRTLDVIYEDSSLVILNKSPNVPVHPTGAYRKNTLLELLVPKHGKVFPLHRLDRETSGVILFAKDSKTASLFLKDLSEFKKAYLVGVFGQIGKGLKIELPLGPKAGSLVRIRQGKNLQGQTALTWVRPLLKKRTATLLLALLGTGRKHQIRAHLSELGFPVIGDKIYGMTEQAFVDFVEGKRTSEALDGLGHHRQFLHCHKVTFRHPHSKKLLVTKCPLAKDLQEVWENLEA